jgi:hypothetical protein
MIGGLARKRGFRRYEKGKKEASGICHKPASKSPNARKSEVVVIFLAAMAPMRQFSQRLWANAKAVKMVAISEPSAEQRVALGVSGAGPFRGRGGDFLARFWTSKDIFAQ